MPEVAHGSHDYTYTYVLCMYLDETIMVHGDHHGMYVAAIDHTRLNSR